MCHRPGESSRALPHLGALGTGLGHSCEPQSLPWAHVSTGHHPNTCSVLAVITLQASPALLMLLIKLRSVANSCPPTSVEAPSRTVQNKTGSSLGTWRAATLLCNTASDRPWHRLLHSRPALRSTWSCWSESRGVPWKLLESWNTPAMKTGWELGFFTLREVRPSSMYGDSTRHRTRCSTRHCKPDEGAGLCCSALHGSSLTSSSGGSLGCHNITKTFCC